MRLVRGIRRASRILMRRRAAGTMAARRAWRDLHLGGLSDARRVWQNFSLFRFIGSRERGK
jgi:hypothetical protein